MTPARPGQPKAWRPLLVLLAALALTAALQPTAQPGPFDAAQGKPSEEAYRANNLGVARLEQFDYPAAAEAFRKALAQDPGLTIARVNLAIALFYAGDLQGARREAAAAAERGPALPHPTYLLGLIARAENRTADAIAALGRVRELDAGDPGAATTLGQIYLQERKYSDAADLFRAALEAEPYNVTAAYGLATALVRAGQREQGTEAMARFQRLRDAPYATTFSQNYLEQGRYAEAITSTGAEPELVDERVPSVTFADVTARVLPESSRAPAVDEAAGGPAGVTLADMDGDGDLDLIDAGPAALRLYINNDGRFTDGSGRAGLAGPGASGAVAADYDNDGHADLAVLRAGGVSLYRQGPGGRFADVTRAAGLPPGPGDPRTAAWLDADHDGDLDLMIGGAAPAKGASLALFRNNGNGTFADITVTAGLASQGTIAALAPTDYDNRRDIDLLVTAADAAPMLFRNMRDGSFRDAAADAGLTFSGGVRLQPDQGVAALAIADVNKDGYTDAFFGRVGGPGSLALSDGRGRFVVETLAKAENVRAAQFADYDGDGLLDLIVATDALRVLRNLGRGWMDVTERAVPRQGKPDGQPLNALATGDLDGDGDSDVVVRGRHPSLIGVWRNDGGNKNRSLRVRLAARVSNRSAIGAKVEIRAGSLRQKLETSAAAPPVAAADLVFGLGSRAGADVVRVLWPAGILQAETPSSPGATVMLQELDRKPSSCPYLFTWNGERFEFVTDFLGGGEMGYLVAPGVRSRPDPDEYVRIDGRQLRARDGKYELRVTNELEETLFLDRVELVAVAHPAGVEVYPNEGLVPEPAPFALHAARGAAPPLAAVDEHGHDVLERVSRLDRRYPDDFALERIRGYAAAHHVALTVPPSAGGRRLILLTGWTDYAFSGDNFAASHAGLKLLPPSLEFKDDSGRWRTAIDDIGIPVGRPQTLVVDLNAGKVPPSAREIRISSTMRIYWDRILAAASESGAAIDAARIEPDRADLRWRGFSAEATPDGREPYGYDYARVSLVSPWKLMPGRYTREGDVRDLLSRTDDMFVVSRPGDEIALSFDARALPPLPAGWTRTFLFYADGFSKEMNLHSASPDAVGPMPFHGMTSYPYSAPEAYPSTPAHREYLDRYNTRIVPRMLPPLEKGDP